MVREELKLVLAGMYVLKLLDLEPSEGGIDIPDPLPPAFAPVRTVIARLVSEEYVGTTEGRHVLTERGIQYLATLTDEAEAYIDEFDEEAPDETIREIRRRRLDPLRVRFLWGWYQGEFDDLDAFRQRRASVANDWQTYLVSDEFYVELEATLA